MVTRFQNYTSVQSALETISRLTTSKPRVEIVRAEDSYGRVSAEDIASPVNVPDKERSHMDGYAIVASDLAGASSQSPRILAFAGDMELANTRRLRISKGKAIGIVTGGELPIGADAVVPVEDAERIGDKVYFHDEVEKGHFCYPVGVDVKKGQVVIRAGAPIRAQDIGILSFLGIRGVRVNSRPRVALIATGNELTGSFNHSNPRKVRDSHSPILEILVREVGGVISLKEIVRDDLKLMSDVVKRALRNSDILVTLGGTSLGKADLVERALRNVSKNSRIIHGIKMDRGRVAGIAAVRGKPVVMLPGPVQGAMNAFILLALPFISRITVGGSKTLVTARLAMDWKARGKFKEFTKVVYVRLEEKDKEFQAHPMVAPTESISVLTESNGFLVVPEKISELRAGETVSVGLLPGFSYVGRRSFGF